MAMNIIFNRSRPQLLKTLNPIFFKPISTFPFLSQEPQHLSFDPPNPPSQISSDNWKNPSGPTQSLVSLDFLQAQNVRLQRTAQNLDLESIKELFADWMTLQKWNDMKLVFEYWINSFDKNGQMNKPDLGLFNHYLRANVMMKVSPDVLLDLASGMDVFGLEPNTASYNLILKAMHESREIDAAVILLDRMIEPGKHAKPDEESFDLVVGMFFKKIHQNRMSRKNQTDEIMLMEAAFKYIDLNLKYGYSMSLDAFSECVRNCTINGSLDTLVSIIQRCKKMEQNKALFPDWKLCLQMLDCAMKADNSELAYSALEFMAKWMIKDENTRPPRYLSVEEGLVVSLLATAGRTYSKKLLDGAWSILKRSLRQKKVASAEAYIAKIHAHSSLGHVENAFNTLNEFESLYGGTDKQAEEDLFSPFTALYPLVLACSHSGFATLDSAYFLLEKKWIKENPPYKSVAALNCIILGCANIWDADRAYQTFEAISTTFGLTPDINSYNGLICAYGKLEKKREDALKIYEQLKSLGIKPNAMTYELLVDAHLIERNPKSALSIIDEMVISGYTPTKEILKKVRRRCIREMDDESNDQVEALARNFGIRMGSENRRNLLFNLQYSAEYAQERLNHDAPQN